MLIQPDGRSWDVPIPALKVPDQGSTYESGKRMREVSRSSNLLFTGDQDTKVQAPLRRVF